MTTLACPACGHTETQPLPVIEAWHQCRPNIPRRHRMVTVDPTTTEEPKP